jgi:4-hydroxybenzoate polyprenyltransferase
VKKVLDIIFAARPMLLLPAWSIYLISYHVIFNEYYFSTRAMMVLASLTLMTAGFYYINQIFDYKTDMINQKVGFLQRGLIHQREMLAAYLSVTLLSWVLIATQSFALTVIILTSSLLGFFYSVPPIKLKDRPLGGLLANGLGFGLLIPLLVIFQMQSLSWPRLFLALYFFFAVSAGYLLTIIPDREGDAAAGKNTLGANYSNRALILQGLIFLLMSLVNSIILKNNYLIAISSISLLIFAVALAVPGNKVILFACKFPILLMAFLAGYYYPVYFVFVVAIIILTRLYYHWRFGIIYPRLA